MTDAAANRAREATVQAFLNCYCREVGDVEVVEISLDDRTTEAVHCRLSGQAADLWIPLAYRSPLGRHRYDLPAQYRPDRGGRRDVGHERVLSHLVADLAERRDALGRPDELLFRALASCRKTARFVRDRRGDDSLTAPRFTFREAEQSVVFGHQMHPTPKDRRGVPPHQEPRYAPERRGSFPLRYFRADPDIVESGSALSLGAVECAKRLLREDPTVSEEFVADHVESNDVLVPVHPWQADYLRAQPHVRRLVDEGLLVDLGERGREFSPTTSVRTLYAPEARFMVKTSMNVQITNSVRTNDRAELERGLAVAELLDGDLGDELAARFPKFEVVHDPAYLTVDADDDGESGFEVLFRENPFRGEDRRNVTPLVALCQDAVDSGATRLRRVVETVAEREGRSTAAVSRDWFKRYLDVAVEPVAWLYLAHGVAVEAHQQNAVLALDDGYPARYYQRDNQGYYVPESRVDHLREFLPNAGERLGTVYPDDVADERLRYQLFVNSVFGLVDAFGAAGLADERDLLARLHRRLEPLRDLEGGRTTLVSALLDHPRIPRKGNLLTRFHDLDEMAESLDDQSVYVDVRNPLVSTTAPTQP